MEIGICSYKFEDLGRVRGLGITTLWIQGETPSNPRSRNLQLNLFGSILTEGILLGGVLALSILLIGAYSRIHSFFLIETQSQRSRRKSTCERTLGLPIGPCCLFVALGSLLNYPIPGNPEEPLFFGGGEGRGGREGREGGEGRG